jgi:hypothetical protein
MKHQFNVYFQDSGDLRNGLLLANQPRHGDTLHKSFLKDLFPSFLVKAASTNVKYLRHGLNFLSGQPRFA